MDENAFASVVQALPLPHLRPTSSSRGDRLRGGGVDPQWPCGACLWFQGTASRKYETGWRGGEGTNFIPNLHNVYQYRASLTRVMGNHTLQFGGEMSTDEFEAFYEGTIFKLWSDDSLFE